MHEGPTAYLPTRGAPITGSNCTRHPSNQEHSPVYAVKSVGMRRKEASLVSCTKGKATHIKTLLWHLLSPFGCNRLMLALQAGTKNWGDFLNPVTLLWAACQHMKKHHWLHVNPHMPGWICHASRAAGRHPPRHIISVTKYGKRISAPPPPHTHTNMHARCKWRVQAACGLPHMATPGAAG